MNKKLSKTIKKSFLLIEALFTPSRLLEFLCTPADKLNKYNLGLGTMIRLKVLRPRNTLYRAFVKEGVTDKDKMTMTILKAFHEAYRSALSK